jgi:hypothetical protein
MSDYQKPSGTEVYLNEQRADLECFRAILLVFFARMLDTSEASGAVLDDMERAVELAVDTSMSQGHDRMRQMILFRSAQFFQSLRDAKGLPPKAGSPVAS